LIGRGQAVIANSLDEALALARSGRWSLAILDFDLGGVDSTPVADILEEQGVPLVFVSGDPDHETALQRYSQSCFLTKPYTFSTLEGVIETVLP
jgi:DNA-binding response OmpR family regulator